MTGRTFDPGSAVGYAWAGDFLERYAAARTRFDGDAFLELFGRDAVLQPHPFEPPLAGANAIRAYLLQRFAEEADADLTFERHWVSGATILAAWHASYVQRRDGRHTREAGFLTAEMKFGQVERLRIWTVVNDDRA